MNYNGEFIMKREIQKPPSEEIQWLYRITASEPKTLFNRHYTLLLKCIFLKTTQIHHHHHHHHFFENEHCINFAETCANKRSDTHSLQFRYLNKCLFSLYFSFLPRSSIINNIQWQVNVPMYDMNTASVDKLYITTPNLNDNQTFLRL